MGGLVNNWHIARSEAKFATQAESNSDSAGYAAYRVAERDEAPRLTAFGLMASVVAYTSTEDFDGAERYPRR